MKRHSAQRTAPLSGLTAAIVKAASQAGIGVAVSIGDGPERRLEYVSDVAARLLGYEPHELFTRRASLSYSAEDSARVEVWRQRRALGENVPSVIEREVVRKDRSTTTVRVASSVTVVDGQEVVVDFLFDTEHKRRARTLLERSETRFRDLIEVAPEGVVIAVSDQLEYANPALLRLLGYDTADDLRRIPLSEHVHPDDLERVLSHMRLLLETGEPQGPTEIRNRRRDGSYISVEVVAIFAEWEGQAATLAIGRDLSERKQQQAELVQADRLTAVGTLAAGVAHEINNPLAYVLLNLQYLLREVPKFSGDSARLRLFLDRLDEARHGTERVRTIVRDLRAFSRTDQVLGSFIDVRRALLSAIKVAGAHIEERARIIEEYEPVPHVEGNAARLEQVFLNLLINAAQAFSQQGSPDNEIRVRLRTHGEERVIVEVADNGTGIEPELLNRVFDPFFTTKPPGVGTGLGLPICHSIVTQLGGEISVESVPDRGTVFRVSLPARRRSSQELCPTSATAPASVARARVLVVDDELPLAAMLSRVLSDEHDVFIATSARDALNQLRYEQEFDIVLCDLLMPGMSGMDLYRELQRERPGLEQSLVFMTGGAFTSRAAEFLLSVPNHRLEKPFDLNQVRALVRRLSHAQLRDQR